MKTSAVTVLAGLISGDCLVSLRPLRRAADDAERGDLGGLNLGMAAGAAIRDDGFAVLEFGSESSMSL